MDLFAEEKSYKGANRVKIRYWERDGKITAIELRNGLILPVTYQKGGHIFTNIPGYGRLEFRGTNAKTSFLSHAAAINRSLNRSLEINESIAEHNKSIAGHNKSIARAREEQSELLRAA